MQDLIRKIRNGENLTKLEAESAFTEILVGAAAEEHVAEFLLALKNKGETVDEIVGAVRVMRTNSTSPDLPNDVIDVCGTGGDGLNTLNISTAVAFVVVACGVRVAKHGNKAVSSASGSSDVLTELGLDIAKLAAAPREIMNHTNFCYMHAPLYHPAMKFVAPIRAKLKTRTIFNLLGPLSNPAHTKRQLIGVYDAALLRPFAEVLRELGTEKAWVVHGEDGLDEISISAPTQIAELDKGAIDIFEISPEDFGLKTQSIDEIKGGDAKHNAEKMRELFDGKKSAYRDIVLLNSAAALLVAEKVEAIEDGIQLAEKAIDSGKVRDLLEKLSSKV